MHKLKVKADKFRKIIIFLQRLKHDHDRKAHLHVMSRDDEYKVW